MSPAGASAETELPEEARGEAASSSGAEATGGEASGLSRTFAPNVHTAIEAAVSGRSADMLSEDEASRLAAEVDAAIPEELTTRVKHKCFEQRPLEGRVTSRAPGALSTGRAPTASWRGSPGAERHTEGLCGVGAGALQT